MLGACERVVLEDLLGPLHLERVVRRAHDAGDLHRNRALTDRFEGIVGLRVLIQEERAMIGRVVIGFQPVASHDDRIERERAHVGHEACEVPGDLCVGRRIVLDRGTPPAAPNLST